MTPRCWRSVVQVLIVRVDIGVVSYEAMTPQYGRSVVQVLVVQWILEWDPCTYDIPVWEVSGLVLIVRVDIGVVSYEAMVPQCGRSVFQVLPVRVDTGAVGYEAMTGRCMSSVVQVLVVRVDIGVVTYEAITPQCNIGVVMYEALTHQCRRFRCLL